jgi:hypothetical protein
MLRLTLLAAVLVAAPVSAAGPTRLLVSRTGPLATVRIDALPTGGGPARTLVSTPPRGEDPYVFA